MTIINKFGGEIIGNPRLVKLAVKRIKEQLKRTQNPVVVVSALAGVTDKLVKLGVLNFTTGVEKINKVIEELTQQHRDWAKRLKINNQRLERDIQNLKQGLENDLMESKKAKEKLALQDRILSYGEKWSFLLFTELLQKQGIPVVRLTGEEIGIITDNNFGDANINKKESLKNIRAKLKNKFLFRHFSNSEINNIFQVPVIAGFIGKTREGQTTTLGRGGSDTTACLVGVALNPSKIILWKNVPGVLSADPRIVNNPKTIKALTYGEAEESGKVIHDKAIDLIRGKNVQVEVVYIANPAKKTIVDNNAASKKGVKIISLKDNLQLFIISSERITRPGALYEIADIISKKGINMVLIRNTKEFLYIVVEKNAQVFISEFFKFRNKEHNLIGVQKKIEALGYQVLAKEVAMVNAVGRMDCKTVERFNHLLYRVCPETDLGAFPYQNCLRLEAIVEKPKVNKLINKFHKEFIGV